jgi:hypothetical protein
VSVHTGLDLPVQADYLILRSWQVSSGALQWRAACGARNNGARKDRVKTHNARAAEN